MGTDVYDKAFITMKDALTTVPVQCCHFMMPVNPCTYTWMQAGFILQQQSYWICLNEVLRFTITVINDKMQNFI